MQAIRFQQLSNCEPNSWPSGSIGKVVYLPALWWLRVALIELLNKPCVTSANQAVYQCAAELAELLVTTCVIIGKPVVVEAE